MADAPVTTPATPAATPSANPNSVAAVKAETVKALGLKPTPVAPKADTPATPVADKSLAEIAKLSAKVRELETRDKAVADARETYAKDPKAGLAKFLGIDATAIDGELVKLSAAYFGAAPGTEEKADAKVDLDAKVAALEADKAARDAAAKEADEKAKAEQLTKAQAEARDATFKILEGFATDGQPDFPYSNVNGDAAKSHVVRTANEIAIARKLDLSSMPDDDVVTLLREANGLVEAEYAEQAALYASIVPKAQNGDKVTTKATTTEASAAKAVVDRPNSAPVRTAVGNVAKPATTPIANKTHVSIKEAKDALKKQLASARRN